MTSYQRRKQEIEQLRKEVEELKTELYRESKIFYSQLGWHKVGHIATGLVIDGKLKEIYRADFTMSNNETTKIEIVCN